MVAGNRAFSANDRLDAAGHGEIAGIGHAMGDDGRFERDESRPSDLATATSAE